MDPFECKEKAVPKNRILYVAMHPILHRFPTRYRKS